MDAHRVNAVILLILPDSLADVIVQILLELILTDIQFPWTENHLLFLRNMECNYDCMLIIQKQTTHW